MTYTLAAVLGVVVAALLDLAVFRTRLLGRRAFWTAYAIVLVCQLIVNGLLTGLRVVRYDPATILGPRLVWAPIEDVAFGFALVLVTLTLWVWAGRRRPGPVASAPARTAAGHASPPGPAGPARP